MVPVSGRGLVPQNGGQRNATQPFVAFRCPPFWGTKIVPVLGTNICDLETLFSISELLEYLARGPKHNLQQLPVLSLSTGRFRNDLKLS